MTVTEPGPLPGGRPADASTGALDGEALRTRVAGLLERARARTRGLTDAVDEADLVTQHSPLMSPLVWDLAHVGSQEELWLVRDVGGREPLRPEIDGLYDAFQHSRAPAGAAAARPAETRAYVAEVREKALDMLSTGPLRGRRLVGGLRLRDDRAARAAARRDDARDASAPRGAPVLHAPPPPPPARRRAAASEVLVPAGPFTMGTDAEPGPSTTSVPRTSSTCPPSGSTPSRSRTTPTRRSSTRAATTTRAGGASGLGPPARPAWSRRSSGARLLRRLVAAPVRGRGAGTGRRAGAARVLPRGGGVRRAGRASGCPPRRSGRRRPGSTPATGRSRRYPWGDGGRRRCTRTWAAPPAARRRPAPTRRARRRWACIS